MSKDPKKTPQAAGPALGGGAAPALSRPKDGARVVYCGPTIPGVAVQYTTYTNGTPAALAEAVKERPVLGDLVVPLDQLPEVRRQFHAGAGRYYTLYHKAQGNG